MLPVHAASRNMQAKRRVAMLQAAIEFVSALCRCALEVRDSGALQVGMRGRERNPDRLQRFAPCVALGLVF